MKRKQHVLILHPHFTLPGGAGKFVLEVGERLAKLGYKVTVISMQSKYHLKNSAPNVRFIDVKGPLTSSFFFWILFPFWYWRISKMIDVLQPDVLFPQVFPAQWWALIYKRFHPSLRVVWMCQEPSAFIHSRLWINAIQSPLKRIIAHIIRLPLSAIDKSLARQADVVLANSKFSLQAIKDTYHIHQSKLAVVYLGVSANLLSSNQAESRQPIAVTVSRLSGFKNIDFLIKTFVQFANQKQVAWQFYIVGDGEKKEELKKLIKTLHAEEIVLIRGQLSDVKLAKLLKTSTLYLSAALDEPFGISLVEAQAAGVIPIAHNSGGPQETIINHHTGRLVNQLNAESYLEAMDECLQPKHVKSYSIAATNHGKSFTWQKTTSLIESVLFPGKH